MKKSEENRKIRQTVYDDHEEYEIIDDLHSAFTHGTVGASLRYRYGGHKSNICECSSRFLDETVESLNRAVEKGIFDKKSISELTGKLEKVSKNIKSGIDEYHNVIESSLFLKLRKEVCSLEALYELGYGIDTPKFAIKKIKDGINTGIIDKEELKKALEDYDQRLMAFVDRVRNDYHRYHRTDDNIKKLEEAVERGMITADERKELVLYRMDPLRTVF